MAEVRTFQLAGSCHGSDSSKCQDQIYTIKESELTTIVLCDGAGFSSYGRDAAELSAETVAIDLHLNFDYYQGLSIPDIKRKLISVLEKRLMERANELQIPPALLATTIMAVSVSSKGQILAMHLGDGRILWKTRGDTMLKDFSLPQRGYQSHSTFLTMNCPLYPYMRIYRWCQEDLQSIILLTDGMDCMEDLKNPELFSIENQEKLQHSMISCNAYDDMSYIVCEMQ